MDEAAYVTERVVPQIEWYDLRAGQNKIWYRALAAAAIALSAAVPVAVAGDLSGWVAAMLGGFTTIVVGLLSLLKCQENWVRYRSTAEMLKKERFFFETRTGPYAGDDDDARFDSFVERFEGTVSTEHQVWRHHQEAKAE